MTDRRDREREMLEETEDEQRAETERRAEQLREGWRQHHPIEKGQPGRQREE